MTQTAADPRDEIIETQKRIILQEREKNKLLERKLKWYEEMHGQKELPQNARLAAIALRKLIDTSPTTKDEWIRADLGTMAKVTGVSNSTSSRGIHCLAENTDAIELRVEKHPYDPQQEILYVRAKESFDSPPEITITGEIKRHGGNRRCHCGGELVEKQRTLRRQRYLQCEKCHEIARIYKAEDTNREWPATPFQDETVPYGENEVPFQDETVVDASKNDVTPLQNDDRNTTQVPPTDCNASLSASEIESQAAQLLLEIAGTAPQHIEMCKSGDPKYITIDRTPHQGDILAHIKGWKTKGATLRHPFGLTRASCDEADTPEDFKRLKAAARLLAIVGYEVILEPSPTLGRHKGGGALWVIYERLVDAYSARQTMLQYAPMLSESKEYWPNGDNRRRLPGGKYIEPGNVAWCKLEDAQGNELSHDGAGAALVLLQYQTSAALVNTYDKPAPVLEMRSERSERKPAAQAGYLEKNAAKQIIADFNASHSWDEIAALCGGFNRRGKFLATWRGDKKPDVSVSSRTDLAKDFARPSEPAMDKYDVWCRIHGGANWEAFKTGDIAERCRQLREQERRAS